MNTRPHPLLFGSLLALMVASWSFNFIVAKIGLKYLAPLTLASFRVELAALLMLPIYAFFRLRKPASVAAGGRKSHFDRGDLWTFAGLGFLGVGMNQMCFTVGLKYTTVGHSALIIGMGPITILLLAWLQGLEKLSVKKVLGMAVAFSGVAVLASEHGLSLHSGTFLGDSIIFTGSLAFSLYTVLGKRVAATYDSVSMNTYNYLAGGILVLPLALWQGRELSRTTGWSTVPWQGWASLGFMAVFASVMAYVIFFWALRHSSASRIGALGYLQPPVSTLLGIALLGERLTQSLLFGGVLVLGGVYLIESGRESSNSEAPS